MSAEGQGRNPTAAATVVRLQRDHSPLLQSRTGHCPEAWPGAQKTKPRAVCKALPSYDKMQWPAEQLQGSVAQVPVWHTKTHTMALHQRGTIYPAPRCCVREPRTPTSPLPPPNLRTPSLLTRSPAAGAQPPSPKIRRRPRPWPQSGAPLTCSPKLAHSANVLFFPGRGALYTWGPAIPPSPTYMDGPIGLTPPLTMRVCNGNQNKAPRQRPTATFSGPTPQLVGCPP